ncbi:DNA cytosine methyltransferase [Chryseobacterium indoltheticum]|uniref:Cytosine-specific methyltransferase n=1 Tax=Chryseobacterium indoltheticum TaxID=254 RepID=A0A381FD01_9FLAO|nr:DNA (cytosine-5-)-methyltransferase [Chryseobacterium indoltheticum]AZA73978.1 DNA (cytosine-5-)-methyltransferase [Chryseobacterium indoltheticum]SIQ25152.1 DNA (cytosine-5)-methyltransferase 1 [Chryseobacterium indoltheticum]SUX44431.1 Modification methylase HaeIII [Chryseobacterium indoltheticum]
MEIKDIAVVDLFCGIGGLAHGFLREGFNVVAGIDIDESCRYAFEKNNKSKFISKSVTELSSSELNELFGTSKIKVLVGCAPCQPFSSYTFKDPDKKDNEKWKLLYEFQRLILETKPDIVSMENVSQLINFKKAPVFNDFIETLKNEGYFTHFEIVNCPEYGIPQKRKRLVLIASKLGNIDLIPKTHNKDNFVTVKDAIGKLPPIEDGEFHPDDKLHFARKLSPTNKIRIKNTPYGGSWIDWPEDLKLECHKKESGKSYSSVYGRMKWDEPSPTMTTHCVGYGNGRFGHPEQDRGISLREASILQTFPKKYTFFNKNKDFSTVLIAKQIGNAVPVRLGEIIAQSIKKHLSI